MEKLRFSEYCANCRKSLEEVDRILFVEKELGRCFCSEDCIRDYFQPTVEAMTEDLGKLRGSGDFDDDEARRLEHYQIITLEDPDEVWVDELETGERRFSFISRFRHGEDFFNYIVICLTLDAQPSFIFMSFPTRDEDLVDRYRRGMDLRIHDSETEPLDLSSSGAPGGTVPTGEAPAAEIPTIETLEEAATELDIEVEPFATNLSGHEDAWKEVEKIFQAQRRKEDIPIQEFHHFEAYIEATMDDPEEIWNFQSENGKKWVTFLCLHFDSGQRPFEMIVICDASNLQVRLAFPTIDAKLAQFFRKGYASFHKAFGIGWASRLAA